MFKFPFGCDDSGKNERKAPEMINDAVMELLKDSYGDYLNKQFQLYVNLYEGGVIGMDATDDKLLFGLGLKRQRLRKSLSQTSFNT